MSVSATSRPSVTIGTQIGTSAAAVNGLVTFTDAKCASTSIYALYPLTVGGTVAAAPGLVTKGSGAGGITFQGTATDSSTYVLYRIVN